MRKGDKYFCDHCESEITDLDEGWNHGGDYFCNTDCLMEQLYTDGAIRGIGE